jgi:cobalamin transport system ATP-binding protein
MTTAVGPAGAAIRTNGIAAGYRTRRRAHVVLERVNVTAQVGHLVCLLGPNGSGKSTLLRTLAGLQPALCGTLDVGGADLRTVPPWEVARRVAVVLTDRVAIEALSARRVVELGRYPHGGWHGRLTERDHVAVDSAMDAVGARHLGCRDASLLSDGERQRVMIARALAQEPLVLLLDEPTAFLDAPARVELMQLLRHLARERPLAVVASTHDLDLALRSADVVWLTMPNGELLAGSPEDVRGGGIRQAFAAGGPDDRNTGVAQGFSPAPAALKRCATEKENDTMGSMRSISTMRGDAGETSLAGGVRVSKASIRVETYGTIDELNATLGFARSICGDADIAAFTKSVQQDLFRIGSSLATPIESPKPQVVIDQALVERLTDEVHRLEAIEGMLADWSIPGEHRAAAAFDMARTVCRRAERALVRLKEAGDVTQTGILAYVNRLSDLLWLFGRKLEHDEGISGSLREVTGKSGNRFSRAW